MATQSVEMSVKGRSNELQSAAIVENSALLPGYYIQQLVYV